MTKTEIIKMIEKQAIEHIEEAAEYVKQINASNTTTTRVKTLILNSGYCHAVYLSNMELLEKIDFEKFVEIASKYKDVCHKVLEVINRIY